jgi:glyoxylase-like metal-dependent hydrolase (beta-lactamase superfamily II)
MKTRLLLCAMFGLITHTLAGDAPGLPEPTHIRINEQIHALLAPVDLPNQKNRGYMANSSFLIGDHGVILIDTGFSDEIGQHLKRHIAKITSKPVTHIINTHDHGDHTLGNSAFEGATIISSEKCRAVMEKSGYEWLEILETITGLKFPNTKPVVASTGYNEGTRTKVTLQGIKLVLWVPQGSHTSNDLMVLLPQHKTLIAGDVLVNEMIPSFRDAYVKNWIATLQEIAETPLQTIVPGHGPLMTTAEVKTLRMQMQLLYNGVEAGYKQGLTDSEVRKTLDLKAWQKMKHFDDLMGTNINRTYLEVESANF